MKNMNYLWFSSQTYIQHTPFQFTYNIPICDFQCVEEEDVEIIYFFFSFLIIKEYT